MITSTIENQSIGKERIDRSYNGNAIENESKGKSGCTTKQLLLAIIPITAILLFAAIFIPIYVVKHKEDDDDDKKCIIYNNAIEEEVFDEYEEEVVNITYATLTPKGGYDNILIFLGGISDVSNKYFDLFKSNNTFVPNGTKIYFLSGQPRQMQFMIDYYNYSDPVPGWFNIDSQANLVPPNDFTQAKESLNIVLDEIDRIKNDENVDYKNIYLSGFSQGAMMTNYILLNSRNELGGYIAYSGYVFDHEFPSNTIVTELNSQQKEKLEARKNYHVLATHSYLDDGVFYDLAAMTYQRYYKDYTDFKLLSFGSLPHVFREQPIHPFVKKWLKESMGK